MTRHRCGRASTNRRVEAPAGDRRCHQFDERGPGMRAPPRGRRRNPPLPRRAREDVNMLRFPMRPISVLALLMIGGITLLPVRALAQELQEISRAGEQAILARPGLEMTGARKPDLTIVEYFDYNCPYCKKVVPTFKQLLAEDKKLAIVYKDWPVLGESSVYAARCALAAGWQDKYFVAHDALLTGPRLTGNDQIEAILRGVGVDLDKLKKDLASHA